MKRYKALGLVASLSLIGMLGAGVSEAAFCTDPPNQFGPYEAFGNPNSCSIPFASGSSIGRNANGVFPRRICANLAIGNDADAVTFTGQNGGQIPGCRKHDSTADTVEACDTTGCATAAFHLLTVFTN